MGTRKVSNRTAEQLVKALQLPNSTPQKVNTDPLGWEEAPFRPPVPLMPQYVKGDESWVVDTPRITKGLITLKRIAQVLGIDPLEILSGTLLPNQQAVILRPYDIRVEGATGLTAQMVDDFSTSFDKRYRLNLPKGALSTLNLINENEIVMVFGQKYQYSHHKVRRGSGAKSIPLLYLFNPIRFVPDGLERNLTW